jgi:hypothetical protein
VAKKKLVAHRAIGWLNYSYMKLSLALMIFLTLPVLAQTAGMAKGTYARNGVLISLTNLAPLSSCSITGMKGIVKSVQFEGNMVVFELKEKKERQAFQFNLDNLGEPEKRNLRKGFMRKGIPLRVSGYACTESDPVQAISIDRSYQRFTGIH